MCFHWNKQSKFFSEGESQTSSILSPPLSETFLKSVKVYLFKMSLPYTMNAHVLLQMATFCWSRVTSHKSQEMNPDWYIGTITLDDG